MDTFLNPFASLALLVGVLIIFSILLRTWFSLTAIPALVGFIFLGFVLRLSDDRWNILGEHGDAVFEFLAGIGIIVLLFRVGLESNLHGLIEKLPRAMPVWFGNVVLSGVPGFFVAYSLLGIALIPSLFVATALTATSIAVSVVVWQEARALNSQNGQLLMDVATLDDISGVALMALLLALIPILQTGNNSSLSGVIWETSILFIGKAILFGAFCLIFARYGERPITQYIKNSEAPDSILFILGIGIVIAALAGFLGFPLAIGALFAGLVFSRDPEVVRMESLFIPLYDFFMPFFFIGIGLKIDPSSLASASMFGALLLVVAIFGKLLGAGLPALLGSGVVGATVIGVSMIPRAEIALVIMQEGRQIGDWVVPPAVFSAMVLISAVTCALAPLAVAKLLQRYPQR